MALDVNGIPNITDFDEVRIRTAERGGWGIFVSGHRKEELFSVAADDEGLLEFFAEQLALPAPDLQTRPPNPGSEAKPAEHGAPPVAGDALVKHMVDRFLSWSLPESFNPDGGITFKRVANEGTEYAYGHYPSGTNLLDAAQAETMVRHMLAGAPLGVQQGAAELSAGEQSYRAWRSSIPAEFDGSRESLAKAREMFEQWIGDALPANEAGQVHFGRALAESMSDAIGTFLAKDAEPIPRSLNDSVTVNDVRVALAPFETFIRAFPNIKDDDYFSIRPDPTTDGYRRIGFHEARVLIRAAGLWTADMEPRPVEDHHSDDDSAAATGEDVASVATVRASDGLEDASPAGASRTDDQDEQAPAPNPGPASEPEAVLTPPPPADGAAAKPVERFDADEDLPF